jgi:hemerythrin-like domain-containing protein
VNLESHHRIEETYIFPVLASRMPEFNLSHRSGGDSSLVRKHKEIHAGMVSMRAYLEACKSGHFSLNLLKLRDLMDTWYSVLFEHLNQEVERLGAENMRRY